MFRRRLAPGLLAAALALTAAGAACSDGPEPDILVGVPTSTSTSTSGPVVVTTAAPEPPPADLFVDEGPTQRRQAEPPLARDLAPPDASGWPAPIPFTTAQPVPEHLVFILVAGSDARPGEDLGQTRADSIHLLAVNPESRQGTLLGIPRDSWVEIPGHGRGKVNNALALGGPDLLAATVRRLTGLPVDYYVLTGFVGLQTMVDELGGVDVLVKRRMNDRASGARFQRGWHRMSGAEALAYARNRNDVENGDFSRSEHQGDLIVAALATMRGDVADDDGVARWVEVLLRHTRLDVPLGRLPELGALARRLDPARLSNVVAPGRVGSAGGQSVVFLTTAAAALFDDLRADAVVGQAGAAPPPEDGTTTTTTAESTTTTAPATTSSTEPATTTTATAGGGFGILR